MKINCDLEFDSFEFYKFIKNKSMKDFVNTDDLIHSVWVSR